MPTQVHSLAWTDCPRKAAAAEVPVQGVALHKKTEVEADYPDMMESKVGQYKIKSLKLGEKKNKFRAL